MPTLRRDRFFVWWAQVVSRHPIAILLISWILAGAAVWISAARWNFQSDRNLLISDKVAWHHEYVVNGNNLPGGDDLTVVVDAGADGAKEGSKAYQQARKAADDLGQALRADPFVSEVVLGANFSPGALRLEKMEGFKADLAKAGEAGPVLQSHTPAEMLQAIMHQMQAADNDKNEHAKDEDVAASIDQFAKLVGAFGTVFAQGPAATQPADLGELVEGPDEKNATWQYLTSGNGRLLFIRVTPDKKKMDHGDVTPVLAAIRKDVAAVGARYPGVDVGVTGLSVMESDETEVATWDSTWTSLVAVAVIGVVLITAYHSWKTPLLAMVALGTGICWAYGYLFLVIGHLQVLSVVFNVMLLGLGIAYGIYLSSAFELLRHDFSDDLEGFTQTLAATFRMMGPGILTGALTTAACFATTVFTDFTGVAEMGHIAGVGILLCFVAMFTVFPALLRIFKPFHRHVAPMASRSFHFFREGWVRPFARHPAATLTVAGLLTGLSLVAIFKMDFNYDLVKLQPRNSPSVVWQERIVRDGQESVWVVSSLPKTLAEARLLAAKYRALPTVDDVGGIGLLFPADEKEKVALITAARAKIAPALDKAIADVPAATEPVNTTNPAATAPAAGASGDDFFGQVNVLSAMLKLSTLRQVPPVIRAALDRLDATFSRVAKLGSSYSGEERSVRIKHLGDEYGKWRAKVTRQVALMLDPSPLVPGDMPNVIMRNYEDYRGGFVLEVQPSDKEVRAVGAAGPLDPRFLKRFVEQAQSVDPQASGVAVQIYNSGKLIKDAYQIAGLVALGIVFLIVYFDYQHLHDALLIMVPIGMAFAITFGIMWCIGQSINMANIIVLPLMFGIGVDAGIHVLNRYRQHPNDYPPGLTRGTGKGVTLTCLTAVISFAAMMLSSHRGIASLGFVLATGLLMTMFACWTVMPAWLALRQRAAGTGATSPQTSH